MEITWAFLARSAQKSSRDAGFDVEGIVEALVSNVGYPFRPRRMVLVVRLETTVGEVVEGRHHLDVNISDEDGAYIHQFQHVFDVPHTQRVYVLIMDLRYTRSPKRGMYQFNLVLDRDADRRELLLVMR